MEGQQELARHSHLTLRQEEFAPYAAKGANFSFPGHGRATFPLIAYAQSAYFAQVFEAILERSEGQAAYRVAVQCDMTDVIKEVIIAGRGIGWLPQSAVDSASAALIAPIGGPEWRMPLQVCAYRQAHATSPEINAFWAALEAMSKSG